MPTCKHPKRIRFDACTRKRTTKKNGKRGGSIARWLSKAKAYLRQHKVISKVGNALSPLHPKIAAATGAASALGYGRRRKKGGGFRLAGSGFRLAGSGCHRGGRIY